MLEKEGDPLEGTHTPYLPTQKQQNWFLLKTGSHSWGLNRLLLADPAPKSRLAEQMHPGSVDHREYLYSRTNTESLEVSGWEASSTPPVGSLSFSPMTDVSTSRDPASVNYGSWIKDCLHCYQ